MSFGLPSIKVKPEHESKIHIPTGTFGVPNAFVAGLGATKPKLGVAHPIETSERNFHKNEDKMNMAMLRNIQGLHAPMRLAMEMQFANKVGRHSFLPSSKFQSEIISGRYLDIGFEDILNQPDFCELAGQPHAVIENSLGLL